MPINFMIFDNRVFVMLSQAFVIETKVKTDDQFSLSTWFIFKENAQKTFVLGFYVFSKEKLERANTL